MKKFNTATPSGFPEFSPSEEPLRQKWLHIIAETFEKYGFQSITTPLVEREENLLGKGGNPKEIYALKRVQDEVGDRSHSGNTLRFDHTVPLALYVARHQNEINFPFKRYAIGPVFRGERAQKGRFRQFDQCDIDIIGIEKLSVLNDAIMPAIIIEIFEKLLPKNDFVVRINNRKVLLGFFDQLGVSVDKAKLVLDIVDDLEKLSREKITENLKELGLSTENIEKLFTFTSITGDTKKVLSALSDMEGNAIFKEGVSELTQVMTTLDSMGVDPKRFTLDLKIARGLDYYTGTVYETTLIGYEGLGSICSGGRYEDLASIFTHKKMPGVGISIGITRLLSQLSSLGVIAEENFSVIEVLFIPADECATQKCLLLAASLRKKGLRVDTYLETKKLGKKFDYADKIGVRYVCVIGENELSDDNIQVKNMKTGQAEMVAMSGITEFDFKA